MPIVAIYIPTYNAETLIELTLLSCLHQTRRDFHVYIVDNCSTDNTLRKVETFANANGLEHQITITKNRKNLGRVGNWNKCLELFGESNDDYLKFLFAGDELKPYCLEKQLEVFADGGENLGFVTCANFDEKEGQERYFSLIEKEGPISSVEALVYAIERGCWFGSTVCSCLIKKKFASARFDPLYAWAADFKFWIDVTNSCDAYFLKEALTVFHYGGRKFYSTQVRKLRSRLEIKMIRYHALDLLREKSRLSQKRLAELEATLEQGDDLIPLFEIPAMASRKLLNFGLRKPL